MKHANIDITFQTVAFAALDVDNSATPARGLFLRAL